MTPEEHYAAGEQLLARALVEGVSNWSAAAGMAAVAQAHFQAAAAGSGMRAMAAITPPEPLRIAKEVEPGHFQPEPPKRRIRACVEAWPEAETGQYDPRCCRFPKSCSATSYDPEQVTDEYLEPEVTRG